MGPPTSFLECVLWFLQLRYYLGIPLRPICARKVSQKDLGNVNITNCQMYIIVTPIQHLALGNVTLPGLIYACWFHLCLCVNLYLFFFPLGILKYYILRNVSLHHPIIETIRDKYGFF